jgi:hypothetical protein
MNSLSILSLSLSNTNTILSFIDQEIPSKAFFDVNRLEVLQIGQNYFEALTANIFSNLKHLKTLEINYTQTLSVSLFFNL